jgi:serine/threonine-protein kinase ULK/ATG1
MSWRMVSFDLVKDSPRTHTALHTELDAAARRPDALARRRSSRLSALTRPISALAAGASAAASAVANSAGGSPVSYSPPFTMSSTPPFALPPGAQHHRAPSFHSVSSSPNLHTRTRPVLVPHPVTSYGSGLTYHQTAQDAQTRYPESSSPGTQGLTRVLTSAGMRFFGSPVSVLGNLSRRPWNRPRNSLTLREQDPQEEALVQKLDDLAQKALVVFEFADSKLALCTPGATRPSASLGTSGISPSSYLSSTAVRRRSSAASSVSTDMSSAKLDTLCAEALVLYWKALNLLQYGSDLARQYWDSRATSAEASPTGPEFNESKYLLTAHRDLSDRSTL